LLRYDEGGDAAIGGLDTESEGDDAMCGLKAGNSSWEDVPEPEEITMVGDGREEADGLFRVW
jgi:hypothetical protein